MSKAMERYCTVSQSVKESLQQMKLMREGKLPEKTWDEFLKELQNEKGNNNI